MQLVCKYLKTLWPKPGMEVETDFRIVQYRPVAGQEYCREIVAKGEGLPVGNFFDIILTGEMVLDPQYGDTFVVQSFTTEVKKTRANVLGYLASGAVKGVGPAVAKRIVDHFGIDALDILEKEPQRLKEVNGIGDTILRDITSSFEANLEINAIMLYVGQYYESNLAADPKIRSPITLNKAKKIVDHFGERSLEILQNDIYHLCKIEGFGFLTVDAMAVRMQKPMNTLPRVEAAALYILKENRQRYGHLYMEPEEFLRELKKSLNHKKATFQFQDEELRPLANQVLLTPQIAYQNRLIYLRKDFLNEQIFAQKMAVRLYQDKAAQKTVPLPNLADTPLSEEQKQAVIMALRHSTCIITGGPGTGKTTVTRTFLETYLAHGGHKDKVLLCAPTGRAAKRLSEATDFPAYTVHRAFGLWSEDDDGEGETAKNLELVILDECSMMDQWMAAQVICRISPKTKLVLVGDSAQLPSVGPGNVLHDMIQSGIVPTVELKTVFRQATGSPIAINAQLINQKDTNLIIDNDSFLFIDAKDQQDAMYLLCALYKRAVKSVGRENVQILTPVRKDGHSCGANNLNVVIQKMMQEAPGLGYSHYGRYFCVGDPVIQNRNKDGIYNGEIGTVTQVKDDHIDVLFTGYEKPIPYDDEKLNRLDLAYALTVHKSQGSEFPTVFFPVLKQHDFMLSRNLVYTAVTRGKSRVVIIGNRWELNRIITGVKKRIRDENGNWQEVEKKDIQRKTALAARMRAIYGHLLKMEQDTSVSEQETHSEEQRLAG